MDMSTKVSLGLQVTLYGLAGVFLVLILFYFITKAMVAIARKAEAKKAKAINDGDDIGG